MRIDVHLRRCHDTIKQANKELKRELRCILSARGPWIDALRIVCASEQMTRKNKPTLEERRNVHFKCTVVTHEAHAKKNLFKPFCLAWHGTLLLVGHTFEH